MYVANATAQPSEAGSLVILGHRSKNVFVRDAIVPLER